MTQPQDKMRAEFEAWAEHSFYCGMDSPDLDWSEESRSYKTLAHHMAFCAWQAACAQQSAQSQQAAQQDAALVKPESGRYVLAWMEGRATPIRAMWVPSKWLQADDVYHEDWAEYDEAKDEYFCPEGWYEKNEHEEKNWSVSTPVVAWMELPRLNSRASKKATDAR